MDLTIIITASYVKSHPAVTLISKVIESLEYIHIHKDTPILLAHDYNDNELYSQYFDNLHKYIENKPNIQIIKRDTHGHLTGNVRNAIQYVKTKYILILQHDLQFRRKFNIQKVIEDMEQNPEMKHVRFNQTKNIPCLWDRLNDIFGKQLQSKHYTYTRTPAWSDQNHLCLTEYYTNLILQECKDGNFMEHYIFSTNIKPKSKNKPLHVREEIHRKYGTYIFGRLEERPYVLHMDGREGEPRPATQN